MIQDFVQLHQAGDSQVPNQHIQKYKYSYLMIKTKQNKTKPPPPTTTKD